MRQHKTVHICKNERAVTAEGVIAIEFDA